MAGPLDVFGPIDANPPPLPDTGPPAPDGFFANLSRAFTNERLVSRSDRFDAEDLRLHREYGPILDALGLPASDNPAGFSDAMVHGTMLLQRSSLKKGGGPFSDMTTRSDQEQLIASEIGRRQASDPNFLKGVPATVDGLHKWMLQREGERRATAAGQVASTRGLAGSIGALGGGAVEFGIDTPNLLTLPVGGVGRSVAMRVLTEGLAMAGITAAEQPTVAHNREQLGVDYTAGDFAFNVSSAFVGGTIFRGGAEGLAAAGKAMGSAVRSRFPEFMRQRDADAFGKAMSRAVALGRFDKDQLPQVAARLMDPSFAAMPDDEAAAQLGREMAAGTIDDRAASAFFAQTVPEDRRTPDEKAALVQVGRDADAAETSPFEPTPGGDQAHQDRFTAELDRVVDEGRGRSLTDTVNGLAPDNAARGAIDGGGDASGAPAEGEAAIRAFKQHSRIAESRGVDGATNPLSSASGRYQFTRPTWLSYYRRRYGKGGKSDAIWAKRFDPDLQEILMDDLTRDNARALRGAGMPVTERNLYLMHFLGPKAEEVLRAHPDTPIADLVPPDFIARNPKVLGGDKTAADVIAWADRKMGGAGDARSSAAGERVPGPIDEGDYASSSPLPETPELGGHEAEPHAAKVDDEALAAPIEPADHEARADAGDDLTRPSLRTELFGTPEEHARAQIAVWKEQDKAAGLPVEQSATARPEPSGPAVEVPEPRAPRRRSGPVDVLQAVADAGGLRDDEGHDLVAGRGIPKFRLGAGAIVRPAGHPRARSVDAMGEYLWEKGYFGPPAVTPRPDESQVLDLIERAAHERVFVPGEEPGGAVAEDGLHQGEAEARAELQDHAAEHGLELDPATLDAALGHRAEGATVGEAVARAVQEAPYRDAVEPAGLERFDDPEMQAIAEQADSLEHDLRMELGRVAEGGAEAERRTGLTGEAAEPAAPFNNVRHVTTKLRAHPDYAAAKAGDAAAAARVVRDVVPPEFLAEIRDRFPGAIFVPVAAMEESGANKLPQLYAALLAHAAGGTVQRDVIQINRAFHTGAGAIERMISPPRFEGPIAAGARYVVVDDVTVTGSTLAELANHIEQNGGEVAGSALLVNASRMGVLSPEAAQVELIERKFGDVVRQEFGVEPSALTRPEANLLLRFSDADTLRARIAKARVERSDRLGGSGVQEEPAEALSPPQGYRLEEDGGEVDPNQVLDEIEADARAGDELRACMAPPKAPGGAE